MLASGGRVVLRIILLVNTQQRTGAGASLPPTRKRPTSHIASVTLNLTSHTLKTRTDMFLSFAL